MKITTIPAHPAFHWMYYM